jgi:hypothetical protein
MTAQCSTCWYGRGTNAAGQRVCRQAAPSPEDRSDFAWWPPVRDADWCGAHVVGDPTIYSGTQALVTGSFLMSAAATSVVVPDAAVLAFSRIFLTGTGPSDLFYISAWTAGVSFECSRAGAAGTDITVYYLMTPP